MQRRGCAVGTGSMEPKIGLSRDRTCRKTAHTKESANQLCSSLGLDDPATGAIFGFVYRRFRPGLYYWELLEAMRKLLFVLPSAFFSPFAARHRKGCKLHIAIEQPALAELIAEGRRSSRAVYAGDDFGPADFDVSRA